MLVIFHLPNPQSTLLLFTPSWVSGIQFCRLHHPGSLPLTPCWVQQCKRLRAVFPVFPDISTLQITVLPWAHITISSPFSFRPRKSNSRDNTCRHRKVQSSSQQRIEKSEDGCQSFENIGNAALNVEHKTTREFEQNLNLLPDLQTNKKEIGKNGL